MRRASAVLAVILTGVLAAGPAPAGTSLEGTRGTLRLKSADTVGKGILHFTISGMYYPRTDSVFAPSTPTTGYLLQPGDPAAEVKYRMFLTRVGLTYGLSDYAEVGGNLQVRNWLLRPEDTDLIDDRDRGGLGDTDLLLKLRAPLPTEMLRVGILGQATFPTGDDERRFSLGQTDYGLHGLLTLDLTDLESFVPTRIHVNGGYLFNRNEDQGYGIFNPSAPDQGGFWPPAYPGDSTVAAVEGDGFNDSYVFGAGLEFTGKATLFGEYRYEHLRDVGVEDPANPLSQDLHIITLGFALRSQQGITLKGALDIIPTSETEPPIQNPPDWALHAILGFDVEVVPTDRDKDGIPDKSDGCPEEAEDVDGFMDDDGCPDLDNDGDGIVDVEDKCPDLSEDFDTYEDEDGCPDFDNDGDGIRDSEDGCPNQPEDFDGVEDDDGCPDLIQDTDSDGVPDDRDRCPLKAEDVDGFQDDDGCPDLDNDLDGIPDEADECPNAPETFNGHEDEDGCPDERPVEQRFILRGVHFETGSAAITQDSYATLDEVVRSLLYYPEVRVEIRGYTDSVGSEQSNMELSKRRADSVRQYLINNGIEPDRVVAVGYGEQDPVASNSTPEGRAQNRRIEFHRLN
jgi:outer membrane protein OmpA-like peptidoglycan-associated protein